MCVSSSKILDSTKICHEISQYDATLYQTSNQVLTTFTRRVQNPLDVALYPDKTFALPKQSFTHTILFSLQYCQAFRLRSI